MTQDDSDMANSGLVNTEPAALSLGDRITVLSTAFLGWMLAGLIMVIIPLSGRAATRSYLGPQFEVELAAELSAQSDSAQKVLLEEELKRGFEAVVGNWFARYICAFLLGAAVGGILFGWLGDRIGRSKAMGLSILCYSLLTGCAYFATSPEMLMVLRFLACMGVGGIWPNATSLVAEVWSNVSRPLLAGLIGMAANLGFMFLALLAIRVPITPDSWRWVMLVGAAPAVLGLYVLVFTPESPRWLARDRQIEKKAAHSPVKEIFRPPFLRYTLIGICLGAIPLLGNWGGASWLIPWADKVGGVADPDLKAWTQWTRSGGAAIGALLGGWLANQFGRRTTYFFISLCALVSSAWLFWFLTPESDHFLFGVFVLGFFGTVYFGWLPLYLPELFPTRIRATGIGVTFNFGRILTAFGVLGAGGLMLAFEGDYARVGQITSLVYVLGMVLIFFAPDTSKKELED